jgi:hypothetical protein
MAAVLVVGTIIGLIWADTSDLAGAIAVVTNIVGVVGIVVLLIALPSKLGVSGKRRPRRSVRRPSYLRLILTASSGRDGH